MPNISIAKIASGAGASFNIQERVSSPIGIVARIPVAPAIQSTDWDYLTNTTGTLTLPANHGIVSNQTKLNLYWAGGKRINVAAGTVSGNSVPIINSGSGDNLPADDTVINVSPKTTGYLYFGTVDPVLDFLVINCSISNGVSGVRGDIAFVTDTDIIDIVTVSQEIVDYDIKNGIDANPFLDVETQLVQKIYAWNSSDEHEMFFDLLILQDNGLVDTGS
jgi:hypothetical protein